MQNSLSIFARALATENLSFAFDAKAETASFDVKNRHLTLPVWDVSETVQTMLIAHEIAHALWTPYQESEDILAAAEKEGFHKVLLQRIANMVEDVRIEKMMKEKYPGTRRDFFLGYKEIHTSDMFGFSKMDLDKAGLVNRLNIHFKWGVPGFIDLNLSDEEQDIARMIESVVKFSDVYRIAKILYKHPSMKEAVEEAEKQLASGKGNKDSQKVMDNVATDTTNGIGKKDGDTFTASTVTIPQIKDIGKGIISTDFLIAQFDALRTYSYPDNIYPAPALDLSQYRTFVKDSDAFVRQLVAQFERKKAADEIRRERPKQTGMLNLDRLHQYRTHDDIFISKMVKQDGKNHGIVFMLDMSGSMSQRLSDCFLQVLQLVWFCEKAKIPFEVFGFTDIHPYSLMSHKEYMEKHAAWLANNPNDDDFLGKCFSVQAAHPCPTGITFSTARLLNLASSRDDAAKRERLLAYLYDTWVIGNGNRPRCLSLGGTPTVESLAIVSQFMQTWVTEQNIQIPTIMLVTDGQPNGVYTHNTDASCLYYHKGDGTLTVMNEIFGTAHRIDLKKQPYTCFGNVTISAMLDALRQRLNARCVGMFVDGNRLSVGSFVSFCMSNPERVKYEEMRYNDPHSKVGDSPRFEAMEEAYKDGAFICHPDSVPGYDAFFVVKTPKIVKDEDAIADSGTFTKIKNTFVKTMAKRSGSRVFLTRYVDIVAGQKIGKDIGGEYNHPAFPVE